MPMSPKRQRILDQTRHKHLDPIDYTVHVEEQSLDLKDFIRNEPILDENSKAKPWSRKKLSFKTISLQCILFSYIVISNIQH